MAELKSWTLPPKLRPKPELLTFDIEAAVRSMVLLRAEIPEDAFTASALGTERLGHGVVVQADGRDVVLTIGYLIAEAESIWITSHAGQVVQGHTLAFDYVTGFGLVQPLGPLSAPALTRGTAAKLEPGDELVVLGHGGLSHCLTTRLIEKREFAGYWEYLLDEALFTAPAHPLWGGSALVNQDGLLVGVGSLLVQQNAGDNRDANMYVPIDNFEPVLESMMRFGAALRSPRPWLGLYSTENDGQVVVAGLIAEGPAHQAGVSLGDAVLEVAGEPVSSLAEFYRAVWRQGVAGSEVRLTLQRDREAIQVNVRSVNRDQFLKQPQRH